MRRNTTGTVGLLAGLAMLGATGCQTTTSYFLSTIGLQKKPLAVALVLDERPGELVGALNPFTRYDGLQKALSADLGRPVAIDPCFAFQAQNGLNSGWYGVAVVTPVQYARLAARSEYRILAVPADAQQRSARCAVLIARAGSEFGQPADLRGKVVAFGPQDDSRTHHAALLLLKDAGLTKADLALEPLPVPGSLKHMPDARAVAQSVLNQSSDAGFLDEADWEALPETAEDVDAAAQDKFKVLGRTVALPTRLLISSPKLDQATADAVQERLLAMAVRHPEVFEPLGATAYVLPDERALVASRALMVGEVVEPAETPSQEPSAEAADQITPS